VTVIWVSFALLFELVYVVAKDSPPEKAESAPKAKNMPAINMKASAKAAKPVFVLFIFLPKTAFIESFSLHF
jgi:hypothetical protein